MNIHRTFTVPAVVALLSLGALACEKTPNSEVQSARAELTSERRQAHQEQVELQRKQAEEQAANQNANRDERAELQREHETERAETYANGRMAISEATTEVSGAHENMAKDRRDFDTKSTERLTTIDAKAREMKTKSAKLNPKKKQEFEASFARYMNERQNATSRIGTLPAKTDSQWESAKKEVEQRLDTLELTLEKLEKDL